MNQHFYKIKGAPRHYAWGGAEFIPNLLNIENRDREPWAEWWIGAHPSMPSSILLDNENASLSSISLDLFLENKDIMKLDSAQNRIDSTLSFLFKILDVNRMLAVQVHPNQKQAQEGFQRENQENISIDSPERTYKDEHSKPEMMVALSTCWLLHGFLNPDKLVLQLSRWDSLKPILSIYQEDDFFHVFEHIMTIDQQLITKYLKPIWIEAKPKMINNDLLEWQPEYWLCKEYSIEQHFDRGFIFLFLMNIVCIAPDEAIYQPEQLPHAYLSGQLIEIMSNSDNVLRVGPTKLYVDLDELRKVIKVEPSTPLIIQGESIEDNPNIIYYPYERYYQCDRFFTLAQLKVSKNQRLSYQVKKLTLCLLISGLLDVTNIEKGDQKGVKVRLYKGESLLFVKDSNIEFLAIESGQLYIAY